MTKVSVIIPYFRKKSFVKKTLFSVLKQSYKNFEVIIIYDDINQSDLKYIKKLSKIDKRIKLFINKKNIGAGPSRNKGIFKARGKFISFIDADDVWKINKLKLQVNFMEKKNLLITHTSYDIIDSQDQKIRYRKARIFKNIDQLIYSCDIGLSTVMMNKKIFKKHKFPNLKTKEDFVLWLSILRSNIQIIGFDKNLVNWRKTKNSLSSSSFQKIKDGYLVYYKYMKYGFIKSSYSLLLLSINYILKNK